MYTCKLTKAEILAVIVDEFEKAHKAAEDRPDCRHAVYRQEALRDLLHRIPILEDEDRFYTVHGEDRDTGVSVVLSHIKAENASAALEDAKEAFPNVWFYYCRKYREEDSEC